MSTWWLVRHGETVWNRDGRIQGHRHVPLTERGGAQVRKTRERLAGEDLAAIYSSDAGHAIATAQEVAEGRDARVQTDARLREFAYGEWEGLTMEQARANNPAVYAERITARNTDYAAPGGETTAELLARVGEFCRWARKRHSPDDTIAVVGHGGSLRAVVVSLLGLDQEHFWRLRLSHGSLSAVTVLAETCVLELWNDTSHLEGVRSRTIP